MMGSKGICLSCGNPGDLNCQRTCSNCSTQERRARWAQATKKDKSMTPTKEESKTDSQRYDGLKSAATDAYVALQAALPYVYNDSIKKQMNAAAQRLTIWDACR